MARNQPESLLVKKIKSTLEGKYGGLWIKIHGGRYQQNGIPDLIGCFEGYFIGLEVKVPERRNTVTKLQQQTLDEIDKAKGVSAVVTSVEEAEELMQEVFLHLADPWV
jgi:hypothetical protein